MVPGATFLLASPISACWLQPLTITPMQRIEERISKFLIIYSPAGHHFDNT